MKDPNGRTMMGMDENIPVFIKSHDGCLFAMDYLLAIADNKIENHSKFQNIGFLPSQTASVLTDLWSYGGTQAVYVFPPAEMGMEILSSNNTVDIGTVIHSGTASGGSLTTLISAGENFQTTTSIGDVVILDKSGDVPEYGYITAIISNTEIQIANGFNHGGWVSAGRAYSILDISDKTGAHAVEITYLDSSYVEHQEIVILNGTTVVPTVKTNMFRVNSLLVISAGTGFVPTGAITLRHLTDSPVYAYITAGYTHSRSTVYTVPVGKEIHITDISMAYATSGSPNKEYARLLFRAALDENTRFKTNGIMYTLVEFLAQNNTGFISLRIPITIPEKVDLKISVITSSNGVCTASLIGWKELE